MSEGSPTEQFGPYIVYELLGIGGMAQVHRAVAADSEFERPVALKRMLSHVAGNEDMVKSFVREARLASYLRHENVAQTHDLGRVGDTYFIVMELVTGRDLREVLRHCGATTGPMPVQHALNILNQVCDALDYAHNLCDETGQPLGLIHRDVSPSNVIVSDSGVVKLIDFGIAKASGGGMQTMSGALKGKFAYMAPEYIAGRIDARADLFAVGVIAHELLTNRPLFSGRDDIDTLTRVRDMPIDPPSKNNPLVPPEIDDIVMTALERDPDRRWQHATALRCALTTLTKRLGLVASNAQVVQWLDWAFAHTPKEPTRRETTETDAAPLGEAPSISIEPGTADRSASMTSEVARVGGGAEPTPSTTIPLGMPAVVPPRRPSPVAAEGDRTRAGGERASEPSAAPAQRAESPRSRDTHAPPPQRAVARSSAGADPANAPRAASVPSAGSASAQGSRATPLPNPHAVLDPAIPRLPAQPPPSAAPQAQACDGSGPMPQSVPPVAIHGMPSAPLVPREPAPIAPSSPGMPVRAPLLQSSPTLPIAGGRSLLGQCARPDARSSLPHGLPSPMAAPPGAPTIHAAPGGVAASVKAVLPGGVQQSPAATMPGVAPAPAPIAHGSRPAAVQPGGAPATAVPPLDNGRFAAPRPVIQPPAAVVPPPLSPAGQPNSSRLTILVVVVAAAIAATTVYFVLPLLT